MGRPGREGIRRMNHIHRLQAERDALKQALIEAYDAIHATLAYIDSPKFRCGSDLDGYVSTNDIRARLTNTDASLYHATRGIMA